MNKTVALLAVLLISFAAGCSNKDKKTTAAPGNTSLTEIPPPPPQHQPLVQPQPVSNVQPVGDFQPAPTTVTPAGNDAPVAGKTYIVKKGDTLWSIAQKTYGNGNQYKKIVAANPSIKGDKVGVGQKITLP